MRLTALFFALSFLSAGGFNDIGWRSDLVRAKAEAAKKGKPIFLHFGADW